MTQHVAHRASDEVAMQTPRTSLVIPDARNGGADFEMFVVANSPEHACELYAMNCDIEMGKFKLEPDVPYSDDERDQLFTVREITRGVTGAPLGTIPWEKLQCTFWRLQ